MTVFDTSQFTAGGANSLAHVFGLKSENVTLLAPFVGGGFGGKGTLWFYNQLCVMAARVTGRPVRIALTREGVFRLVGGRTPSRQRVAIAADGRRRSSRRSSTRASRRSPTRTAFRSSSAFRRGTLYAMESYRIGQQVTTVHRIANTFMRAPGESIGTFAVESAIDALAYELKMDPIELRARNEPDADPVSGHAFSSRHLREAYAIGAERFGWRHRPAGAAGAARRRLADRPGCRHRDISGVSHGDGGPRATSTPTARPWFRRPARKWAWAQPPCRRSTPPSVLACRSRTSVSNTETAACRGPASPAVRHRP